MWLLPHGIIIIIMSLSILYRVSTRARVMVRVQPRQSNSAHYVSNAKIFVTFPCYGKVAKCVMMIITHE